MNERGHYTPEQQLWESQSAATIRALTRQHNLYFRAHRLYQDQQILPYGAAHLQVDPALTGIASLRGMSDGLALRILYSDTALHARLLPEHPHEQLFFELLEQLRVESLVPDSLPGMRKNLCRHFARWAQQFHQSGLADTSVGLLVLSVSLIIWSRLMQHPIPEELEDPLEATRAGIAAMIGNDLSGLRNNRHNQQAYAKHALAISSALMAMIEEENQATPKTSSKRSVLITKRLLQLLNIQDSQEEQTFAVAVSGDSRTFAAQGQHYRVFTREYDNIITADKLVRPALLDELRSKLDDKLRPAGLNLPRLIRQLQIVFAQPHRDGWNFGLDEGYIDGSKLPQLISSPTQQQLFKQEATPPRCQASITFLLDCSGSMKRYALPLAMLLDTFARALHKLQISCEILGFSTSSWNGGRPLKEWRRQKQPAQPGRLNESLQIIFRAADQPWPRVRSNIAALLKTDFYREGFDGEAVEWACQRLLQQDGDRRLLIVFSDGCPMDSATHHANDEFYLDNHLRQVVSRYDGQSGLEIYGLGVGLDLSPYYRRHLAIDLEQGVDNHLLSEIVRLWVRLWRQ